MNLVNYDPWRDLRNVRQQMDRLWGDRFPSAWNDDSSSIATSVWSPAVDIKEEQDRFELHADLPGVDAKDIDVTMENSVLTIKGERRSETEDQRENYSRTERVYGSFYRRFALPNSAEADKIEASYKDGVLKVVIPKQERAKPRQISVKS